MSYRQALTDWTLERMKSKELSGARFYVRCALQRHVSVSHLLRRSRRYLDLWRLARRNSKALGRHVRIQV